jgi:hypothetical protein
VPLTMIEAVGTPVPSVGDRSWSRTPGAGTGEFVWPQAVIAAQQVAITSVSNGARAHTPSKLARRSYADSAPE